MDNLKKAKALKLQFDHLGYAVVDGKITTDRSEYRHYLRSGKSEVEPRNSLTRSFQSERFYNSFFNVSKGSNPLISSYYKKVVACLMFNGVKGDKFFKCVNKIVKNLTKLKLLERYQLENGILVKDCINGHIFFYCNLNQEVYRLVNNKTVKYNLK